MPFQWDERVDSLLKRFEVDNISREQALVAIRETGGHFGLAAKLLQRLVDRPNRNRGVRLHASPRERERNSPPPPSVASASPVRRDDAQPAQPMRGHASRAPAVAGIRVAQQQVSKATGLQIPGLQKLPATSGPVHLAMGGQESTLHLQHRMLPTASSVGSPTGGIPSAAELRTVSGLPVGPTSSARFATAAMSGDPSAQFNFAICYVDGVHGVDADPAEAVKWLRLAAQQRHGEALSLLGVCCRDGFGTGAPDKDEALQYFRASAEMGVPSGQRRLGSALMDLSRSDCPEDVEAAQWFRAAAEQGDAEALCWLGACHAEGRGVPRDSSAAVQLYHRAAEEGLARAQYNLGTCYAEGIGVPAQVLRRFGNLDTAPH